MRTKSSYDYLVAGWSKSGLGLLWPAESGELELELELGDLGRCGVR